MNVLTLFFILISVSLSVGAQILLKYGVSAVNTEGNDWVAHVMSVITNSFVLLGLTSYGLSMVVWLYVLSKIDVSKAYPFVGLGFIGTMVFAHIFLNEVITLPKLLGTLMIMVGVVLLAR